MKLILLILPIFLFSWMFASDEKSFCDRPDGYSKRTYRKYANKKAFRKDQVASIDGVYYRAYGNDKPEKKLNGWVEFRESLIKYRRGERVKFWTYNATDSCKLGIVSTHNYHRIKSVHREFDSAGNLTKKQIEHLFRRRDRYIKIIRWDKTGKRTVEIDKTTRKVY